MPRRRKGPPESREEFPILGYYSGTLPTLTEIVQEMRTGFLRGDPDKLPEFTINRLRDAKQEIEEMSDLLLDTSPDFKLAFHNYAFPESELSKHVLGVDVTLVTRIGDRNLETVLCKDITNELYQYWKKQGLRSGETADSVLTLSVINQWLRRNQAKIRGDYKALVVNKNAIVTVNLDSLSDEQRESFFLGGALDVAKTARYIFDTGGQVGLGYDSTPDRERYLENAPSFDSMRLKRSLGPSLLYEISEKPWQFTDWSQLIGDWVGHRAIYQTKKEVEAFVGKFKKAKEESRNIEMGDFMVKVIDIKDNYTSTERELGYRDYRIIVEVSSRSPTPSKLYATHIREIQVTDIRSYHAGMIDRVNKAHRVHYDQLKQELTFTPEQDAIIAAYARIFHGRAGIFAKPTEKIEIRKGK